MAVLFDFSGGYWSVIETTQVTIIISFVRSHVPSWAAPLMSLSPIVPGQYCKYLKWTQSQIFPDNCHHFRTTDHSLTMEPAFHNSDLGEELSLMVANGGLYSGSLTNQKHLNWPPSFLISLCYVVIAQLLAHSTFRHPEVMMNRKSMNQANSV